MENTRKDKLMNRTNKLELEMINYLKENTMDMIIDILEDKDANYIETLNYLYSKYTSINSFISNIDNKTVLAKLFTIYKLIPELDLLLNHNKLFVLHLTLEIVDRTSTENLEVIDNYLNSLNEGEVKDLIDIIRTRLNIININSDLARIYNIDNFREVLKLCENIKFDLFDRIYRDLQKSGLYKTLSDKDRVDFEYLYQSNIPF